MKKLFRSRLGFLAGLGLLAGVNAQGAQIDVFNSSITGNVVWTRDNTYILKEMVFVENGETLTIEAGTVIKGDTTATGSQKLIPSLVVARGGKLFAEGTPTQPIIFTASTDDVNNPSDLGIGDRGLWGGVVILGKAGINSSKNVTGQASSPKYDVFEGLIEEENFRFGGSDDNDSSGVLRYVSIRHGGRLIEVGKEINGLSLAGVGRGTTVEYVEVFANEDDGFEFFGGTVNTKYLVAAFCNDDSFDTDQGYRGKNQFWFVIQAPTGTRNYGGEFAGDPVSPNNRTPLSDFTVYNATFIGAGVGSDNTTDNTVFDLKEDTAAKLYNSIFTDYVRDAVKIQNNATNRFNAGDIDLRNNIWGLFGNGTVTPTVVLNDIVNGSVAQALFTESIRTNLLTNPMLKGISRTTNGGLDPRPNTGSPALSAANIKATPADGFMTPVDYIGAFGPSELWVDRWTALYEYGYTPAVGGNIVNVFNTAISGNVTWYRTNTYILKEMVFVENGETLTIEAGTVIKGDTTATGSQKLIPSLVVA
ncbi:MAG: T9SS C-terminal target domain-containing protein, partial [Verrucomicrobiota bacterium]